MDDLIHRLNALGNAEHDDLEIGFEAAERIIALTAERDALTADFASVKTFCERSKWHVSARAPHLQGQDAAFDKVLNHINALTALSGKEQ